MNIDNHPCFNDKVRHTYGRIHLPVAPRCNIQCNFCNRKFDCVNESRPGVTSGILSPEQALFYLQEVMKHTGNISVVGIAGPGDPFANPEETLRTLHLVREHYPDMLLCVATNGLDILPYLDELVALKVSHITVTINTVDPEIGKSIYAWLRYKKRVRRPEEGAPILLENQLKAVKGLKERDITVKINTIIIPGINDHHIEAVAKQMAELNVDILNCLPYFPCEGAPFKNLGEPDKDVVAKIRKTAGKYIKQMHHCTRCRADAVGLLGEKTNQELMSRLQEISNQEHLNRNSIPAGGCSEAATTSLDQNPIPEVKHIAVASMEGALVNQHLGEAGQLYIYTKEKDRIRLLEKRPTPAPGEGKKRWQQLAQTIDDCGTLLVSGIGSTPQKILSKNGIRIFEVEGIIEDAVKSVFNGGKLNHMVLRKETKCGEGCSGMGMGCG